MTRSLWRRLARDGRARLGLAVVVTLVVAALAAPLIARHDPVRIDLLRQLERPSL